MTPITGDGKSCVMMLEMYSSHERKSEIKRRGHSKTERRPRTGTRMVLYRVLVLLKL